MSVRLRDVPDVSFVAILADGVITRLPDARGAQAIWFECPCGSGHVNLIAFEPTIDVEPTEHGRSSTGGRWRRTGTTLDDLSLTPSIAVSTPNKGECWHGFITNGEVLP